MTTSRSSILCFRTLIWVFLLLSHIHHQSANAQNSNSVNAPPAENLNAESDGSDRSSTDEEPEPSLLDDADEPPELDDVGGFSFLEALSKEDGGITVAPVYYGEVFTNARGGISTRDATQYQGLLDLPLLLDFEKLKLPVGGKFFLLAQNTSGRGLTDDFVGDTLVVSNIDSFRNIMQVGEYWWELGILDDDIIIRLGKQDLNTEFLFIDTASDFIQSTFGLSPSTAFPTYPDQSMGAVALLQLNDQFRLKAGVWDAFSSGGNWGFSNNDSVMVITELEYNYALADGRLPGIVTVGAAYEGAGPVDGVEISAVHEYIFQWEQVVYAEEHADGSRQGLAVFAGYYPRFPGERVTDTSIGDSVVAGLVYTGLIPQRDQDVMGFGVAWAELFQGGTGQEAVFEWFYKARVTSRLTFQPDLQYILSPSGIHPDALVVGARFEMSF